MIASALSAISAVIGGELRGDDASFAGVAIDSRVADGGSLFVALAGERFDGHEFVASATARGVVGAIVERWLDLPLPQIRVEDAAIALGNLAKWWRSRFGIPVLGVTGSNGKTTVKEMSAAILGQSGAVLSTQGNFNNDIGLPLTLLRLNEDHRAAVIEMGANHPGEIAYLASLAAPTCGVVTNAGEAHLEGFGTLEGVARAKGEMFDGLSDSGVAIINLDQNYAGLWAGLAGMRRIVTFGLHEDAQFNARDIAQDIENGQPRLRFTMRTPDGELPVSMNFAGRHNVANALAAAAASYAMGANRDDIRAGLAAASSVSGRLQLREHKLGGWLIDDTYNANPLSTRAAMEFASSLDGRHWIVLGDMGELGPGAEELHKDLGRVAHELGFERLYTCGQLAASAALAFDGDSHRYDRIEDLADALEAALGKESTDVIPLIKASRSMHFDRIVDALLADAPKQAGHKGV